MTRNERIYNDILWSNQDEIDKILKEKKCTECGQCNQFNGVCVYDGEVLEDEQED